MEREEVMGYVIYIRKPSVAMYTEPHQVFVIFILVRSAAPSLVYPTSGLIPCVEQIHTVGVHDVDRCVYVLRMRFKTLRAAQALHYSGHVVGIYR